jgi:hypothetical protein
MTAGNHHPPEPWARVCAALYLQEPMLFLQITGVSQREALARSLGFIAREPSGSPSPSKPDGQLVPHVRVVHREALHFEQFPAAAQFDG